MSRPLTLKNIQKHTECLSCGLSEVSQEKILISDRELKKIAKLKKRKSGNYYYWYYQIDCKGKGHEVVD